ncbi:carbonic anhydrase [bacterium]|nr:carbonic anhydrase [bacterium]
MFVLCGSQIYAQHETQYDSNELLKKLVVGNQRFAKSNMIHQNQSAQRKEEIAKGQHPIAVIVSCSDSRVPPEIVFDLGLGDLFVVRSAGNLVDDIGLGSIEYAVEHLDVRLIIVLGHERCGAVSAAVQGGEAPGHIAKLIEEIKPAVESAKKQSGDLLDNAVISNINMIVKQLQDSEPILKEFVHNKKLKIVGARYDLDDGVVEFIK